jgi:hypothetical protein
MNRDAQGYSDHNDRKVAAEILKDLILEEKRSRWPMILGVLLLIAVAGAAGYYFYLPPDQRPDVSRVAETSKNLARRVLNAPVLKKAEKPADNLTAAPLSTMATGSASSTPSAGPDSGLISD